MNNTLYIGLDQSMNSTGICCRYNDYIKFYIVKPNKLTKKEQSSQSELIQYICFERQELCKEDNHIREVQKTLNMIEAVEQIYNTIYMEWINHNKCDIVICMEGISLGSKHTSSVMDLAGLNYLIRNTILVNNEWKLIVSPPSEIKKFATGNGNANKDSMITIFLSSFPEIDIPKVDDIADAYFMCLYAMKYSK